MAQQTKPAQKRTTHLVFSPLEFMERLASAGPTHPWCFPARLVPRPRVNLTRYHGVFAPHAKHRKLITPSPSKKENAEADPASDTDKPPTSKYRISWARLLKRVFDIDVTKCPDCGGQVRVIAAILLNKVIVKILAHMQLATEPPPLAPARGPPIFEAAGAADPFGDDFNQVFT